ncbi:helix-turn-helix domain-containing protein [uncultured Parolsenella sp.]|uniref:helix-turn-helix domain-containing protein n=1 Tax=uncultured Parolsenella sp. TaxID=2083008 RepID=UPI0027D94FA1|nr:helix-turn-helix domain-containing protein [uncultured Parolsenella sp.]
MEFGQRVKKLRTEAGLTQEDIAKKLDLSKTAVGAWENGRAKPRLDKLNQLADLFGVTAAELLGERQEATPSDYVTLPVAVAGHAGEFTDEFEPGEVTDVPRSVWESIGDPDAYIIRVRGHCMDRRLPDQANAVASPNAVPRNGDAVVAEYNGELIIRQYFRGAAMLVLSPDSFEDGFEDIVFDDPETETVSLRGVIKWYQASRVRSY